MQVVVNTAQDKAVAPGKAISEEKRAVIGLVLRLADATLPQYEANLDKTLRDANMGLLVSRIVLEVSDQNLATATKAYALLRPFISAGRTLMSWIGQPPQNSFDQWLKNQYWCASEKQIAARLSEQGRFGSVLAMCEPPLLVDKGVLHVVGNKQSESSSKSTYYRIDSGVESTVRSLPSANDPK